MDYRKFGECYYIRMDCNDEIISTILEICKKENIRSATFSGIGGCKDAEIQTFIPETGSFEEQRISGMLELVSLNGNVVTDENNTCYHHTHADPLQEVPVAKRILKAVGLREEGVEVIACPTCGRTSIEVEKIALEVERRLSGIKIPLKVAVMGCVVNGPGEAREADIGIAGAAGDAILFQHGKKIGKVEGTDLISVLVQEAKRLACQREQERL